MRSVILWQNAVYVKNKCSSSSPTVLIARDIEEKLMFQLCFKWSNRIKVHFKVKQNNVQSSTISFLSGTWKKCYSTSNWLNGLGDYFLTILNALAEFYIRKILTLVSVIFFLFSRMEVCVYDKTTYYDVFELQKSMLQWEKPLLEAETGVEVCFPSALNKTKNKETSLIIIFCYREI